MKKEIKTNPFRIYLFVLIIFGVVYSIFNITSFISSRETFSGTFNPVYFVYLILSGFFLAYLCDSEEYRLNFKRQVLYLGLWSFMLTIYLFSTISVNIFLMLPFRGFDQIVYQLSTINDIPQGSLMNPVFIVNTFAIPFILGFALPSVFLYEKAEKRRRMQKENKEFMPLRLI